MGCNIPKFATYECHVIVKRTDYKTETMTNMIQRRSRYVLLAFLIINVLLLLSCSRSQFKAKYSQDWHTISLQSKYGGMRDLFIRNGSIGLMANGSFSGPYYDNGQFGMCNHCDGQWEVLQEWNDGSRAILKIDTEDQLFNGEWEVEVYDINDPISPRFRMFMYKLNAQDTVVVEVLKQGVEPPRTMYYPIPGKVPKR
jgi:hypothetical protein